MRNCECAAAHESERLANWLLANTAGPGSGNPGTSESAVDLAIRLIRESQMSAVDRLGDLVREPPT